MPAVEDFVPPSPNSIVEEEFTPPPPVEARPAREELLKLMGQAREEGRQADIMVQGWTSIDELAKMANAPFVQLPRTTGEEVQRTTGLGPRTAAVVAGTQRGAASLIEAVETPLNVATLGAGAASRTLAKIAAGTYGWFIGKELPAAAAETGKLAGEGNIEGAVETGIGTVAGAVLAPTLAKHALTRVAPLTADALAKKGVSTDAINPRQEQTGVQSERPGTETRGVSESPSTRDQLQRETQGGTQAPPISEGEVKPRALMTPQEAGVDAARADIQNWKESFTPERIAREKELNDGYSIAENQIASLEKSIADGTAKAKGHDYQVQHAAERGEPLSAVAVDAYGTKLPPGYVREGDIYVYRNEGEVTPDAQRQKEIQEEGDAVAPAQAVAPQPAPIGMGGATPAEFKPPPGTPTGIKNATVDAERVKRGLPEAMASVRRAFGEAWDMAMQRMDTDTTYQDRLITELRTKARAVTDIEDATLLHRQIDLQNEHAKASRDLAQAFDDGRIEDVAREHDRVTNISNQLLELYDLNKRVGTETGRGLAARRQMANEDFTLAGLEMQKRAAKGGKPLTPEERLHLQKVADEYRRRTELLERQLARLQKRGVTGTRERTLNPRTLRLEKALDDVERSWRRELEGDKFAALTPIQRGAGNLAEAIRTIRTIMTTGEFSAVLRQGGFALVSRPIRSSKAFPSMFKALRSEAGAFRVMKEIETRPNALNKKYQNGGLEFTDANGPLSRMEEAYMGRWSEEIPIVKGFSRSYTVFLNRLRADSFDALEKTLSRTGEATPVELKAIGNFVNVMTGRGNLGAKGRALVNLATIFFAPRYVASRFQMIAGQPLWQGTRRTRKLIAGEYARYLVGIGTVLGLAKHALKDEDGDVEIDPRSSDAGKIRIGNTRVDLLSGLQQATVFSARTLSRRTKTQKGEIRKLFSTEEEKLKFGRQDWADVTTRFLRTKLAPAPATFFDLQTGENVVGEIVTPESAFWNLVTPITYGDIYDVMKEHGTPEDVALSLLAMFGAGVTVHKPKEPARSLGTAP